MAGFRTLFTGFFFWGSISLFGMTSSGKEQNKEDSSIIIGESLCLSEGARLTLSGDLSILSSNLMDNNGQLRFCNSSDCKVSLSSGDLGKGEFIVAGSADCYLYSEGGGSRIGQLNMETEAGTLIVSGDLTVIDNLRLDNGIIRMSNQSNLLIESPDANAIAFNDGNSYVVGLLTRNVMPGETYHYPVGGYSGFYPFLVDKPKLQDNITVSFDEKIAEDVRAQNSSQNVIIEEGVGWKVQFQVEGQNTFYPGLFNPNQYADDINIGYLPEGASALTCLNVSQLSSYLRGAQSTGSGLYVLASKLGVDFVNFIYINNQNKSVFEIPGASNFSIIRMKLFNRLGSIVFKSDNYLNEFDARNYPDGTYFYEMTLEKDTRNYVVRNFIEIKHEK